MAQSLNWYNLSPTGSQRETSHIIDAETDADGNLFVIFDQNESSYQDVNGIVNLPVGLSLLKIDRDGQVVLSKSLSTGSMVYRSLRFDSSGNGYLIFTGSKQVRLGFGGMSLSGTSDKEGSIFSLKIDQDANVVESEVIPVEGKVYEGFFDFDINQQGQFRVLYAVEGNAVDADQDELFVLEYLALYDTNWNLTRELTFSGHTQNKAQADTRSFLLHNVTQSPSGEFYLTGYSNLNETTSLNAGLEVRSNKSNSILVKLNANMDYVWSRSLAFYGANTSNPVILDDGNIAYVASFHTEPTTEVPEVVGTDDVFGRGADLEGYVTHLLVFTENGEIVKATSMDRVLVEDQLNFDKYLDVNGMGNMTMPVLIYTADGPINVVYSSGGSDQIYEEEVFNRNQQYFGFLEFSGEANYEQRKIIKRRGNTRITQNMGVINSELCGSYFIYGQFYNTIDLSNDADNEIVINNTDGSGDYFLASYENQIPEIYDYQDSYVLCDQSRLEIPFKIIDEDVSSLEYSISLSDITHLKNNDVRLTLKEDEGKIIIEYDGDENWTVDMTLRATDLCGFWGEAVININNGTTPEKPKLNITEEVVQICEGESVELFSNFTSQNLWSNGATTQQISVSEPGEYWVKQIAPTGCESVTSDTVRVVVFQPEIKPEIIVNSSTSICEGESVVLRSSLSGGMHWSNGLIGDSITVSQSGVFTVMQVSDCGNGIVSDEIVISVKPVPQKPMISVIGSTRICEDDQVTLKSSSESGNLWSNGMTSQEITVRASGKYWLNIIENQCVSITSDTLTLEVDPQFQLNINNERTLCEGFDTIRLIPETSASDPTFTWSTGEISPDILVNNLGQYWVEVSQGACSRKAYVEVTNECKPVIQVPNAFSPNNDGINDDLEIMARGLNSFELFVFDKWGNQVFYTSNFADRWDGASTKGNLPPGSYPYKIVYSGLLDQKEIFFTKSGFISIIR